MAALLLDPLILGRTLHEKLLGWRKQVNAPMPGKNKGKQKGSQAMANPPTTIKEDE